MAILNRQTIHMFGLEVTYSEPEADGDEFLAGQGAFLHVKNGSGGDLTLVVNSIQGCSQGHDHNVTVVIPDGEERWCGPYSDRFLDENGRAHFTTDVQTGVQVAAIRAR